MPFGSVKPEPVRVRVKAGRFANRDDPRQKWMYRPWRRERTTGTVGSSPQSVAKAIWMQLLKPADGFGVAFLRGQESLLRQFSMFGSQAGCQHAAVKMPTVTEIGGIAGNTTHPLRINRSARPRGGNRIQRGQFRKLIGIRQITNGIPDSCLLINRIRIAGYRLAFACANQKQATPVLRNPKIRGIQNAVGQQ